MSALSGSNSESSAQTDSIRKSVQSIPPDRLSAPEPSTKLHHQHDTVMHQYQKQSKSQMSSNQLDIIIDEIDDYVEESRVISKFIEQGTADEDAEESETEVHFDRAAVSANSNGKICLLSSKGLSSGNHEWRIQVLQSDVDLQEIGVVSTNDLQNLSISNKGAIATAQLKARSFYGCELGRNKLFYGSWNEDNSSRCFRDLTTEHKIGWVASDVIRVVLNLNKWRIKFFLNGKAVSCYMPYVHTLYILLSMFPLYIVLTHRLLIVVLDGVSEFEGEESDESAATTHILSSYLLLWELPI